MDVIYEAGLVRPDRSKYSNKSVAADECDLNGWPSYASANIEAMHREKDKLTHRLANTSH